MAYRGGGKAKNPQTLSAVIGREEKIEHFLEAVKRKEKNKEKKYFVVVSHLKGSDMNYKITFINQVKDVLRIKKQYSLFELQVVDFLTEDDSRTDFELSFSGEITFHFFADTWEKKKQFLVLLYRLCKNILPKETLPSFNNVNTQMLAETIYLSASLKGLEDTGGIKSADNVEHEYKYLTIEEAKDIEAITADCEWETMSAEAYINKLTMELSGLDKANIHSIMNVEKEVMRLFQKMDDATKQLDLLDEKLTNYSDILTSEESKILNISEIGDAQSIRAQNNQKLLQTSEGIQAMLDMEFNPEDFDNLNDRNLETFSKSVQETQQKVDLMQSHQLRDLYCIQNFLRYCKNFLDRVPGMLSSELEERFNRDWQSKHRARHYHVNRFSSLLSWCREYNPKIWNSIYLSYQQSVRKFYEKEISNYFKDKTIAIQKKTSSEKTFSFAGKAAAQSIIDITASQRNLHESLGSIDSVNKGSGESMSHLQQQNEQFSKFDGLFSQVLEYIVPLISDEEEHLNKVFGVPYMIEVPHDVSEAEREEIKKQNKMTHKILLDMFGSKLEQDLISLIELSCKVDNYFALFMYLRLSKYCYNRENSVFLTRFLSSLLIIVKRNFEVFINHQVIQIRELKANKNKRCGILTCVHRLALFMNDTERIFDGRERRTEIERGYSSLLNAIFEAINRVSKEQQKVPVEVVLFENYHHISQLLRVLKIESLSNKQSQAQKEYEMNLNLYVNVKLGNPIEKISEFFEGVKQALPTTARPEEVGFQIKFSRNTLKSLIKQYNLKDIKKSVEHVITKIEKHLSEEEGLYRVVCDTYCRSVIRQIIEYQQLMKKCYPDSGLAFDFRPEDISSIVEERTASIPPRHRRTSSAVQLHL